jgi:branched-chain amino acid transport system ATP-binding protein
MTLFAVEGLTLRFGGIVAIRDLSFAVERGEIFAIIGPNGAGKTSVLNVVSRVFAPSAGTVRFEGADITRLPRHAIADLGIARTFQNLELFERASVIDNLLLGRHRHTRGGVIAGLFDLPSHRRREDAGRAAVEEIIERLDLSPWRDAPVGSLPYGVRKVVELGRALALEPKLLFLDEPASGLNSEETRDLSFWIEDIRRDLGVTIVMIEHDMSLVSAVADRVLCMNQGTALAIGTPAEVQAHADVRAAYLGA